MQAFIEYPSSLFDFLCEFNGSSKDSGATKELKAWLNLALKSWSGYDAVMLVLYFGDNLSKLSMKKLRTVSIS